MIVYRPATLSDALFIADNLRLSDREELEAAHGADKVKWILEQSIRIALECSVAELDGVPFAIYGVCPGPDGFAVPWLLGTSVMERQYKFLCMHMKHKKEEWLAKYGRLLNLVHAAHLKTIRWLQWLGFTIAEPVPHGPEGQLFHPFFQVSS